MMLISTLSPTLTGTASGGVIVRPVVAGLEMRPQALTLVTTWIARVTLPPPIQDMPPDMRPVLLTERVIGPGVG
jgi:hypothetical protein